MSCPALYLLSRSIARIYRFGWTNEVRSAAKNVTRYALVQNHLMELDFGVAAVNSFLKLPFYACCREDGKNVSVGILPEFEAGKRLKNHTH